jgi:nucleoside-diphosphate-sugar epimerase
MMSKIFVTGASGFVGSRLLGALRRRGDSIAVLDRSGSIREKLNPGASPGNVETVSADLLQPELYDEALRRSDLVIHLAALTGRATEREHIRINAQGTEILLERCERAGVRKILFVSSIAVKFPDRTGYHYAEAKARAEEAVRRSGLSFTIIRPTIILGRGSPILAALEKLSALPIIPIFGDGRVNVQPIYVDDLVDFILAIVGEDLFRGETLELGGPVILSIEELLQTIRRVRKGSRGISMHIPLSVLKTILQAGTNLGLQQVLPVTPGQLSSFRFDGTIESNSVYESRRSLLRDVQQMLRLSFAA